MIEFGEIAGGLSCSKRKGRESYMLFSDPISFTRQAAITHISFDERKINILNDMNNISVTTVSGWGTEDELTSLNIQYIPTKDIRSGLINVLHRGVDALYAPEMPAMYSAKEMGKNNSIKAIYMGDVNVTKLHLCMSKKFPNSTEILDEFNEGLRQIKRNGEYNLIQSRYI